MHDDPALSRAQVATFGVLTAVLASGYGVMFTVLDDYRDGYGIGEAALGLIVGIGFFSSFLAQIFIAPIADRGHARHAIFAGMSLTVAGLLGMAWGDAFIPLFLARFVMGIGVGTVVPAVRRIVILGDPRNLGTNLGLLLSADVTGFALGPAISAVLVGPFGLAAPFLVIAAATVACLPVVLRVRVDESEDADVPTNRFAFDLLRRRAFLAAACLGAAVFLMIGTFDALWALVLDDLEASTWVSNLGITFFALPLIVLGSVGGRLAQSVGPFRLGAVGIMVGAVFMFLYGHMPSGGAMLAVGMVHAVADGLTIASGGVAIGLVVERARQASAQGMIGAVETLTAAIMAPVAGVIYEHHGRTEAYTLCAVVMAALAITSIVLARSEGLFGRTVAGEGLPPSAVGVPGADTPC